MRNSHYKSKTLIAIDFSDKFERNTSKHFKHVVSKVSLGFCLQSVF